MKRTTLDKFIGFFSPVAEARRLRARMSSELALRAYEAAQDFNTSDWTSATKSDANAEIKVAQAALIERSRDITRNNPFAAKALDVIVSNVVGDGIVPSFHSENESQVKILQDLWKLWGEGSLCDFEGRTNFYGLQSTVLRSTVESGEVLPVFRTVKATIIGEDLKPKTIPVNKIQVLESDFLVTSKDEGNIIQGVEFDNTGLRTKYHVFKTHPGGRGASSETVTIAATEATHVFRQGRPNQVRGVPWNHPVINVLKDLDDYQKTMLIRQKISACFSAFITDNGNDSLLDAEKLKAKRQLDFQLTPASVRYLSPGQEIKFAEPPAVSGYSDFMREGLRAVAAGYGISYEALTGDYSNVNYSSARMAHIEFMRNVEAWRWNLLIPLFCEPVMKKFLEWAVMNGANIEGVRVEWTAPAHSIIDPTKEILALQREVRAGFKTYGEAVRELGRDPDSTIVEFAKWNEKIDANKLAFDSDPRKLSQIGFAQANNPLNTDSKESKNKNFGEEEKDVSEDE